MEPQEALPGTAVRVRHEMRGRIGVGLPFGYRVRREGRLLILRRPDGDFVAAFFAARADPFEIEARV